MRTPVIILILLLNSWVGFSQIDEIDSSVGDEITRVINLITHDRVAELSSLIEYPLRTPYPLPDIKSREEFILYSPVLFDSAFKQQLSHFHRSEIFEHNYYYGIGTGDIWFNEDLQIVTVNYVSETEKILMNKLTNEELTHVHSSVKPWKRHLMKFETEGFLVWIDETADGLRYVSWSKSKKTSDQPNLILYNGVQEFEGTAGGQTFTFTNEKWKYIVDDDWISESEETGGLHLRIYYEGEEKASYRATIIK